MPYNTELDTQVYTKSVTTETGKITVSVWSYNNGPKKVQIVREIKDNEGNFKFTRLGRISKPELEKIIPLLQEASSKM